MNAQTEPFLEQFVKDEEIKDLTESIQKVAIPQQEPVKPKPDVEEEKKNKIEIKAPQNNNKKENSFNKKMREEGQLNIENRKGKGSTYFSVSPNFLSPFDVIKDSNKKIKNERKQDIKELSLGINNISKEENSDLDNIQSIYGINQKETIDPVKQSLINKLRELEKTKEEINKQFNYDKEIYLKKIKTLERAYNSRADEGKLNNLEKRKEKNEKMIRKYKSDIEKAEKEKIKDRQKFNEALKSILKLKNDLIYEINELEIKIKTTSVEDYEEMMKDNPTKIDKINFRPNDSRYLLTNEYETSKEEEESFSSYAKLNNINNTPDVFDINKQNIFFNKTMNNININNNYSQLNTKNSKIRLGTNNDNINEKVNSNINNINVNKTFIKRNTFSKKIEGGISLKQKEIKDKKGEKDNKGIIQQEQNNNINIPQDNKRIYPKDPEFINNEMILIRNPDEEDSDTFY